MSKTNLFIAGESGNKAGRPAGSKYSSQTLKGKLERFLNRNLSAKAMQKLWNGLTEPEQAKFMASVLNYIIPRQTAEGLSAQEVDEAYNKLMAAIEEQKIVNAKAS